ncbi:MAG: type I secretion system permease/ATPase [Burkholderiaceae bacterium]|nr:type I secretion system permease/ATPase [Burkholderiaceae bacterium]
MISPSAPSNPPNPGGGASDDELRAAFAELRPALRRAAGFGAAASVLALAPSWYMLEVYDRVVNSRSGMTLAMLTLAIVLAYLLTAVQEWARGALLHAAGASLDARLGPRLFDAAMAAQRRRLPEGGPQALADLRSLREALASPAFHALFEAPMVLICFALLYALNPWIGVVAMGAALLQGGIGWMNQRRSGELLRQANQQAMAAQADADRSLAQAPTALALGMLGGLQARWQQRQGEALALQAQASVIAGRWQAAAKLLQNGVNSGFLGLSAWFLLQGQLAGGQGMLIVAGILGGRALTPFVQVITQWSTVQQAREAWQRLQRLLAAEPAPQPGMPLPAPRGELRVEGLSLLLPGSSTALLRDLNFALAPGQVLAVLGASGAGKSTLARLLVGLQAPTQGKVRLDGVDVASWPKAELGPHLGYLPQGVDLLDGSLAENIARFGDVSPEQLDAVIEACGLRSLVEALPEGLQTRLGPDGARLSGGQRQRVALARAMVGKPALVVLDEPNAHLDEEGDAALLRLIEAARRRGCSFVVVTHRIGVLQAADRVLVLHEGQQRAFGPRDEVLAAIRKAGEAARQRVAAPVAA